MTKHRYIIRAAPIAAFLLMYFADTTQASESVENQVHNKRQQTWKAPPTTYTT